MNWLKYLNESLDYIEHNLDQEINLKEISMKAYSSYHHFLRTFFILSGLSLSDYIRKRRLTKAASELITTDQKVIDIAAKYQYTTPESFTKAFKEFHGVTPRDARKFKGSLNSCNKLSFQLNIGGLQEMNYKLVHKESLTFTGYVIETTSKDSKHFNDIPSFWQSIMKENTFQDLLMHSGDMGVVGVIYDYKHDTESFKYMIGVESDYDKEGVETVTFGEETFAAFEVKGALPKSVQNTLTTIYKEWFPSSNYEHSGGPELEVYPMGDGSKDDYICYYWIPIKQK